VSRCAETVLQSDPVYAAREAAAPVHHGGDADSFDLEGQDGENGVSGSVRFERDYKWEGRLFNVGADPKVEAGTPGHLPRAHLPAAICFRGPPGLVARLGIIRGSKNWPKKEWLLNRALRIDDDVAEALYSRDRLVPTYTKSHQPLSSLSQFV
jgi:hypothetical protein